MAKPVDAGAVAGVEVLDLELASVNDEPGRDHEAGHRAQENGVTAQDAEEYGGCGDEFPRVTGYGEGDSNVCAAPDVDVFGECRREIEALFSSKQVHELVKLGLFDAQPGWLLTLPPERAFPGILTPI